MEKKLCTFFDGYSEAQVMHSLIINFNSEKYEKSYHNRNGSWKQERKSERFFNPKLKSKRIAIVNFIGVNPSLLGGGEGQ